MRAKYPSSDIDYTLVPTAPYASSNHESGILQALHQLLPWLRGSERPTNPIVPMLNALKTATESYLQEQMKYVEVVLTFHQSDQFLEDLSSALSELSLKTLRFLRAPSGMWVWDTQCMPSTVDWADRSAETVTCIDYTKVSLTATTFDEEGDCVYENHCYTHHSSLGSDVVSADPSNGRERLQSALKQLLQSSSVSQPDAKPVIILKDVLVLGETGNDPVLRQVLDQVLKQAYNSSVLVAALIQPEPVFAASRAAAWNCWRALNDPFKNFLIHCDSTFDRLVNWLQPAYTNGEPSCSSLLSWRKQAPNHADL